MVAASPNLSCLSSLILPLLGVGVGVAVGVGLGVGACMRECVRA